jgi:hypothetical protein
MIIHWTNDGTFVADKYVQVGTKLCGLTYENQRPDSLSLGRYELEYFRDHPDYLVMLIHAMQRLP